MEEKQQLRSGIVMLDPAAEAEAQEELKLLSQSCLLLFQSKNEEKDWFIVEGRIALINLLIGMIEEGNIDIDNSYIMSDSTKISQKFTVREFVKIANDDLLPDQPVIYIDDDDIDEE